MPKTYTVKEVADILGFSTNSIYTFLKEKRLRGVRIGKGRFRIPEEELSRVLHLSKKSPLVSPSLVPKSRDVPIPTLASTSPSISTSVFAPVVQEGDAVFIAPSKNDFVNEQRGLLAPNIFDWFIGLGAVVAGIGLFLFNSSFTTTEFPRMIVVYPIIRVVLIGGGIGILISSLFGQTVGWKRVFQFILAGMGVINAYGLMRSGDMEGAALYGALAFVIALTNLVRFGGIVAIGLYVSFVSVLYPLVMMWFPTDMHIMSFALASGISALVLGIMAMLVAFVLLVCFWGGYAGNRVMFLIGAWLLAMCDIALAIWYAHLQYWSRSFFVMVIGAFTAILPYWWPLQQKLSRRYTILLHGLFACIGIVMILALLVVYLLQQSVWGNREREIINKLHLGHSRLTNAMTSVQSTLVVAASNGDFVASLIHRDITTLYKYSKIVYESNPNIRRLVFLDKDGMGIALYPYGTFDEPNFSYRDYYQEVKKTGKPYVSDVFLAKPDQTARYVVVLAVPLYDAKAKFVGVVTASMDLDRIGLQLNQIATSKQGEYFVVVDGKGVILSHPDSKMIGSIAPKSDPLYRALQGEDGITQGMLMEKISGMMAYMYVPEVRWAISLRIPTEKVLTFISMEIWIVFGVVSALIGVGIFAVSYLRDRVLLRGEPGP